MKWFVFMFFALLPLQWFAVASTPLGQGRLHQIAILGFAMAVLLTYRLRVHAPVLRQSAVFVIANIYMLLAILAVGAYRGEGPADAIQHLLYLAVFVGIGGFFYRLATSEDARLLNAVRAAAPILCASLIAGMAIAIAANGINPGAVLAKTIASGDPEIFQKEVFKSAFAGFGIDDEEVQGNLRHEIFGSVLLAMLVSTWAMRIGALPTRRQSTTYRIAMITGVVLLSLSLSRSIIIAAVIWPLLGILRTARRGELHTRQIALTFGFVGAVGLLMVTGLAGVISNRFLTDTTSYESRAGHYDAAFAALPDYWVTGGYDTAGASSHNFLIDALLRDGIFAAIPAAVIIVALIVAFTGLALRLHLLPLAMVPVVAALALPLVRMGTSGGGLIPPVEWVALGFVAGACAAIRTKRTPSPELDQPRASRVGV